MLNRTAAPLRAAVQSRAAVAHPRRSFAAAPQPHPLSRRATPSGPSSAQRPPPQQQQREQKWSNLTLILLATLTGSVTYALGRVEGSNKTATKSQDKLEYAVPTQEKFDKALQEIKAWFPADEMDQSRETLVAHGYNEWGTLPRPSPYLPLAEILQVLQPPTARPACPEPCSTRARPTMSSKSSRPPRNTAFP
jgi:D-lactate dehydrogenase (cytochrome)